MHGCDQSLVQLQQGFAPRKHNKSAVAGLGRPFARDLEGQIHGGVKNAAIFAVGADKIRVAKPALSGSTVFFPA